MTDLFDHLPPDDVATPADRFGLQDEVALITGGGGGMGRASALTFAAAGADIALADRQPDGLDRVATDIRGTFDVDVTTVEADVTDREDIERTVETAVETLGTLDVLANIAGVSTHTSTEEIDPKTWDLVQAVNLRGAYLASRAAYPHLCGGGRILNISSIAAVYGASTMSHYAAAKAGVRALTRSLANEWAGENIRVNAVAPGPILTPGALELFETGDASLADLAEEAYDRTNVDREIGSPAEVADAFLFFASRASSYVTGETLVVAGPPPVQEDVSVTRKE